jgi:hypothetical protein
MMYFKFVGTLQHSGDSKIQLFVFTQPVLNHILATASDYRLISYFFREVAANQKIVRNV